MLLKYRYADSYNFLIEENKSLKVEINDLRANIKINKEIIQSMFTGSKDKSLKIVQQLKEENNNLYSQYESITKERDALRCKVKINIITIIDDSVRANAF